MQSHTQAVDAYLEPREKDYYRIVYSFLKKKNIKSVLDIGGAAGDFSWFGDTGINFVSLDKSQALSDLGRKTRAKKNINHICQDIILYKPEEIFDATCSFGTLCTTQNPNDFIEQYCKYSSKYVIIMTAININSYDILISHRKSESTECNEKYESSYNIYSKNTLQNIFAHNGFKIISCEPYIYRNKESDRNKESCILKNRTRMLDSEEITMNQLEVVLRPHLLIASKID
ncbi:class I SAM-dependent methyltransferase [bacterium]|nr:class I SAM-dependent methyltransferase [bacterium]